MKPTARTAGNREAPWVILVVLLSFPSVAFVILHVLYRPGRLPENLDLVVAWVQTLAGMAGALLTLAAFAVSVISTFQTPVSSKAAAAMWACVLLSFLGCLYAAHVRP
jgi:hypothetical protein